MNAQDYIKDPQGRLVPRSQVEEIDLLKDELVRRLFVKAMATNAAVCEFKTHAFSEIEAFRELGALEYGMKMGGKRGNLTLTTFDGSLKIMITCQDFPQFDHRLDLARQLIREYLDELTADVKDEIQIIIDDFFETNSQGHVSVSKALGLRRYKFKHPKWIKAMDIIADSVQVQRSKAYVRVYKRNAAGDYDLIPLDGSSALEGVMPASRDDLPTPEPAPRDESKLRGIIDSILKEQGVLS